MLNMLNLSGKRQLPMIRQNEACECGLACVAMIAGYYGFQTDLVALRQRHVISMHGMTMKSVADVANSLGFNDRGVKLDIDKVFNLRLPAIIHWDMNHYVVLKSATKNKFAIHDPALGERSYNYEEFSKHFTGVALELNPTEKFEKRKEKTTLRLSDLWGRLFGLKTNLLQLLVLSIVLQLFVLASPFYLQIAVDEVLTSFDIDLLLVLALGFGGFSLINVIAQTLRSYVLLYFGSMLSFQMMGNLFRHLLRLPVDFFEKRHIGDIVSRFGSMAPIKAMLTEGLIASILDGVMAITTLVLMFVYSPALAFVALIAWAIYFALRMIAYRPLRARQEDLIVTQAKEQSTFIESLRSITSLKLFGGEAGRQQIWQNKFADTINDGARLQKLNIWFASANSVVFGMERIILIYIGVKFVLAGDGFTVGMLFAFLAYKRNFTEKASALVERAIEFRMLSLHLERIADIAHTEGEELDNVSDHPILTGSITCQNVSYKYSMDNPNVLNDVNIHIKAGESVAIIGPSGCGKTTLLKIMTGLFQPSVGQVLIDDRPINEYGLTDFRKQIGVVMQDDDLLTGSISENISFFDSAPERREIMRAAQRAMIHNDIMAMPMGYESLIGDMGSVLSGGQKQRLMLARALYRQPKILFMDEGTAHLDIETERMVNSSVSSLGITRIIIAHRPETIKSVDRVIDFNEIILEKQYAC